MHTVLRLLLNGRVCRLVILGLLPIAAWLAFVMARYRYEATTLTAITNLGGIVIYEWEVDDKGRDIPTPVVPERNFWTGITGRSLRLKYVWGVDFSLRRPLTDNDLSLLRRLPSLRGLGLIGQAEISDEGLAALTSAQSLQSVSLNGTGVTDKAVDHLLRLRELRYLDIRDTKITNHGIERLRTLPYLEDLVTSVP